MNPKHLRPATRPLVLAGLTLLALAGPALGTNRSRTPEGETLTGTHGKDAIDGKGGEDELRGLAGDDTYHFADGWGTGTLQEQPSDRVEGKEVPGGTGPLSFAAVADGGVDVWLIPQWRGANPVYNQAVKRVPDGRSASRSRR